MMSICDEWVMRPQYMDTMEYSAAIKKNEKLKFAGKWVDLEKILLSQVTQDQKDKSPYVFSYCEC